MTKKIFLLAMAAMAMASCSQDETIDINQGKGIGFRTSADKITRGAEINNANIEDIYVTALDERGANLFAHQLFHKEDGIFSSNPLYYWPSDGSDLKFHAYAPEATEIGGDMSFSLNEGNTLTGFTPNSDVTNQVDLIYATQTGNNEDEESGVLLTFDHMLSQVSIKAKNDNSGYIYKVKGVKIAKPVSKGNLDFDKVATDKGNAWTWEADKAVYTVEYETERTLDGTAQTLMEADKNHAMLIPQQLTAWDGDNDPTNDNGNAYLAVLVNITTKAGAQVYPYTVGEYGWAAVGISTKWEMGQHYVYTLDFSAGAGKVDPETPDPTDPDDPFKPGDDILGGAIKFTVTVNPWLPEGGKDKPIDM